VVPLGDLLLTESLVPTRSATRQARFAASQRCAGQVPRCWHPNRMIHPHDTTRS